MKLRAMAIAVCLVGTGTYARAYDYLDSRGYRHWCQSSCERKGIHVPKSDDAKSGDVKSGETVARSGETGAKSGETGAKPGETGAKPGETAAKSGGAKSGDAVAKSREVKSIDENDLAWQPPRGVKWQVVPEKPARADTNLFKPDDIAKDDIAKQDKRL
jgi:hypothetical protein